MAYSPIAFIAPNYSNYGTYWLKAYLPGSTTPKLLAVESTGTPTFAKLQLNVDGFFKSAGGALIIPHVEGAYDAYLFQTEAEADANNTAGAVRLSDNITPLVDGELRADLADGSADIGGLTAKVISEHLKYDNVAAMALSDAGSNTRINLNRYYLNGPEISDLNYIVKTAAQAATDGDLTDNIINHSLSNGNVAVLIYFILSVRQAGAKGDNVFNDQPSIQACINLTTLKRQKLFLHQPASKYRINLPLIIGNFTSMEGENDLCFISKHGNATSGLPQRLAPQGGGVIYDIMDVDAVIIADHIDNAWASFWTLKNIFTRNESTNAAKVNYGLYMPRARFFKVERCGFQDAILAGVFWFNAFQGQFEGVYATICGVGFLSLTDNSGNSSGTSLTFTRCYASDCGKGFSLFRLYYSTFNAPANDGSTVRGYEFINCRAITINSLGIEIMTTADYALYLENSRIVLNGLKDNNCNPTIAKLILTDNSTLTANAMEWGSYLSTPNAQAVIEGGSRLVTSNSSLAPNGTTFITYNAGSSWVDSSLGVVSITDSTGTKTFSTSSFLPIFKEYNVQKVGGAVNSSGLSRKLENIHITMTPPPIGATPTVYPLVTQVTAGGSYVVKFFDRVSGSETAGTFNVDIIGY